MPRRTATGDCLPRIKPKHEGKSSKEAISTKKSSKKSTNNHVHHGSNGIPPPGPTPNTNDSSKNVSEEAAMPVPVQSAEISSVPGKYSKKLSSFEILSKPVVYVMFGDFFYFISSLTTLTLLLRLSENLIMFVAAILKHFNSLGTSKMFERGENEMDGVSIIFQSFSYFHYGGGTKSVLYCVYTLAGLKAFGFCAGLYPPLSSGYTQKRIEAWQSLSAAVQNSLTKFIRNLAFMAFADVTYRTAIQVNYARDHRPVPFFLWKPLGLTVDFGSINQIHLLWSMTLLMYYLGVISPSLTYLGYHRVKCGWILEQVSWPRPWAIAKFHALVKYETCFFASFAFYSYLNTELVTTGVFTETDCVVSILVVSILKGKVTQVMEHIKFGIFSRIIMTDEIKTLYRNFVLFLACFLALFTSLLTNEGMFYQHDHDQRERHQVLLSSSGSGQNEDGKRCIESEENGIAPPIVYNHLECARLSFNFFFTYFAYVVTRFGLANYSLAPSSVRRKFPDN